MHSLLQGMCVHIKCVPSQRPRLSHVEVLKVSYCLKWYCLFELVIIPLDCSGMEDYVNEN